jgi:N-acetylneuraminic acid mutarotase
MTSNGVTPNSDTSNGDTSGSRERPFSGKPIVLVTAVVLVLLVASVVYFTHMNNGGPSTTSAWAETSSLPISTFAATSVAYHGYLYEIGGYTTGVTATVDYAPIESNGTIGSWIATTSLPSANDDATSVVYNGYLYEIGGNNGSNSVAVVDYAPIASNGTIGSWTATTSLPIGTEWASSVAYHGYLYEIGGYKTFKGYFATVDYALIKSNGTIGPWRTTTALSTHVHLAVSVAYNGYLYEMGGATNAATLATVDYALIKSNGTIGPWRSTASLPNGIYIATSATHNGYLYEIGGNNGSAAIATVDYALIKSNGTIGPWRSTASLPNAINWATSVAYHRYLYEIGGYTNGAIATIDYALIKSNGTIGP